MPVVFSPFTAITLGLSAKVEMECSIAAAVRPRSISALAFVLGNTLENLPVQQQGIQCNSDSLCEGGSCTPASLEDLEEATVRNWVRVGHGRGYKGISTASGYKLTSFLTYSNTPAFQQLGLTVNDIFVQNIQEDEGSRINSST